MFEFSRENLSVLKIKSIEKLSNFELIILVLPKSKMFTKSLSISLMISLLIDLKLFMRVFNCNKKWWQCRKKRTLFSTLKLHEHSGSIQYLNLWLTLWSQDNLNLIVDRLVTSTQLDGEFLMFFYTWFLSYLTVFCILKK